MGDHNPGFLALVEDAKTRVREISCEALRGRMDEVAIVDVREESEFARDHLQGAAHLGKGILERDVEDRYPDRDAELVLYCGGGYRSALAADALQKMGYTHVLSLAGGIRSWREAAYPLER